MSQDPLTRDLADRIARGEAVVIAGAGVARATTHQAPDWKGLLRSGVERCSALDRAGELPKRWAERQLGALDEGDLDELLGVATQVTRRLGGSTDPEFRAWLRDTIAPLRPENTAWLDAIRRLGAVVFTTNYDDLMTQVHRVPSVTWKDPERIQEVLRRDLDAVVHLHGHHSDPSSVVLGVESYTELLGADRAQALLHALSAMRTLVLIGFGAGVDDPNFTALRRWIAKHLGGSSYRHFHLVRKDELRATQERYGRDERIYALSYGENYADLPGFLDGLRSGVPVLRAPSAPLAPADPLPLYLHGVETDNSQLVAFFQDRLTNAEMGAVYVRLDLQARHELKLSKSAGRGCSLRELLELHGDRARWMILGDPGSGKTTLLRHLTWELSRETGARLVPIFVRLRQLVGARGGTPWKRILSLVEDEGNEPALPDRLDELRREGRLVVMLDGLDEVGREHIENTRKMLVRLDRELESSALVVTSRRLGYVAPSKAFREADVLDLDAESQVELLSRCLGDDARPGGKSSKDWIDELRADPGLRGFAENPLLLTLVALLLQSGGSPSSSRSRLYDQVLDLLLDGKHKHKPTSEPVSCKPAVKSALACIAFQMTAAGETAVEWGGLEQHLARMARLGPEEDAELQTLLDWPPWEKDPSKVLAAVAERTGILKDDSPKGARKGSFAASWSFWHRTFQEALTAQRLDRLGLEQALEHAADLSSNLDLWGEPFALLTGRQENVEDADRLLGSLIEVNEPLGLRALATAQRVSEDMLESTITRLRDREGGDDEDDDESERTWRVYGRIVELVGEPERGLKLLDRLRARTTNGADLYHIDAALAQAEELYPDRAQTAASLRRRLFEHLPDPSGALFEHLPGKSDEPLWRRIEPGDFRMGSGDDDPGRFGDEQPAHEVRIAAPFELMRVPVTNAMYAAFDRGHRFTEGRESHPVVEVTWYEAVMFSRWMGARLPSEAEWEYACRAGTKTPWSTGGALTEEQANIQRSETTPVGSYAASPWELYDMHGNVDEWCQDSWHGSYEGAPADGSAWENGGPVYRVGRGGSFDGPAQYARSACRSRWLPSLRVYALGFRPARVITE
ncbi:MAG: SUMF1/EgtB/PvdO family nonheme iron enzyme [Planctomycetota bacterium]